MNLLIQQGKILYWGTSEWRPAQIMGAYGVARQYGLIPPLVEQPQYNMFSRRRVEFELQPVCEEIGLGLTTWSPLHFGLLTGKYNSGVPAGSRASLDEMAWIRDYLTPERIEAVRQLGEIAAELGITTAQLAIAWLLRRKEVSSVISGATKSRQLLENVEAGEAVGKLSNDVLEQIEAVLDNSPEDS